MSLRHNNNCPLCRKPIIDEIYHTTYNTSISEDYIPFNSNVNNSITNTNRQVREENILRYFYNIETIHTRH